MASLRITFTERNFQLIPTFYKLQGVCENPTETNYTYNVARVQSDFSWFDYAFLYCDRKIDFSRMADNDVKKIKGATITNHKDPTTSISMDSNALQCLTWGL
jgi:hypothetical protein